MAQTTTSAKEKQKPFYLLPDMVRRSEKLIPGGFGSVVKVNQGNASFAIKRIPNYDSREIHQSRFILRELRLLKCLLENHLFVQYRGCYTHDHDLYIVLQLWPDSLHSHAPPKEEAEVKCIMTQLLRALQILHAAGIYHRDIKPGNVLYDETFKRIAVADFGLSRACEVCEYSLCPLRLSARCGTLPYEAPEMLLWAELIPAAEDVPYDSKVDIFSAGKMMLNLLMGTYICPLYPKEAMEAPEILAALIANTDGDIPTDRFPHKVKRSLDALVVQSRVRKPLRDALCDPGELEKGRFTIRSTSCKKLPQSCTMSEACFSVIERMLKFCPTSRPTAEELLRDPWFVADNDLPQSYAHPVPITEDAQRLLISIEGMSHAQLRRAIQEFIDVDAFLQSSSSSSSRSSTFQQVSSGNLTSSTPTNNNNDEPATGIPLTEARPQRGGAALERATEVKHQQQREPTPSPPPQVQNGAATGILFTEAPPPRGAALERATEAQHQARREATPSPPPQVRNSLREEEPGFKDKQTTKGEVVGAAPSP